MPDTYRSQHAGTIADLMRQKGRVGAEAVRQQGQGEAQRAMVSGQAWGNAIQNIGQTVSGSLKDFADYRQDEPNRLLRQRQSDRLAAELSAMETEQATAQIGKLAQMVQASNYDPSTAEPIFRAIGQLSPEYAEPLMRSLMEPGLLKQVTDTLIQQTPGYKAPGTKTVETMENGQPVTKIVSDVPGQSFAKPPEKVGTTTVQTVENGKPVTKIVPNTAGQTFEAQPEKPQTYKPERVEVLLDGKPAFAVFNPTAGTYSVAGQDVSARVRPIPPQGQQTPRSPIWVIGADGQFQDLAGVAPPGSKPANTREQGRPVTSGDAGRIAELDTSLDDLSTLSSTLQETKDATGTGAQVGAAMWNPITNLTGWGVDAKKRQGVIDRVKQVIGKALEGGVLRKEDEIKYAKILPTIGDPQELAASKLQGLQDALIKRRQTTIEALSDAGYDVSKFTERTKAPGNAGGNVTMIAPDGTEKSVPASEVAHYKSLGARVKS